MKIKKIILIFTFLLVLTPFLNAANDFGYNNLYEDGQIIDGLNYSINVNHSNFADLAKNSIWFDGYSSTGYKQWLESDFDTRYLFLDGSNANQNINIGSYGLTSSFLKSTYINTTLLESIAVYTDTISANNIYSNFINLTDNITANNGFFRGNVEIDKNLTVQNFTSFKDDVRIEGTLIGGSPVKMQDCIQFVSADNSSDVQYSIYATNESDCDDTYKDVYPNSLLIQNDALNGGQNLILAFVNKYLNKTRFAFNEDAPGYANSIMGNFQTVGNDRSNGFNYTKCDGNFVDCDNGDILVNDDLEVKRDVYVDGDLKVNKYKVKTRKTTDQSITNGEAWNNITWDSEDFDDGNMFNNLTNNKTIIVNRTGYYFLSYHIKMESQDKTSFNTQVLLNNAMLETSCDTVVGSKESSYVSLDNTGNLIYLNEGDQLILQVNHDDAGGVIDLVGDMSYFQLVEYFDGN